MDGMIPTEGDTEGMGAVAPAGNAIDVLRNALGFGRKKHGLPEKFFDDRIDRSGMSNNPATNSGIGTEKAARAEGANGAINDDSIREFQNNQFMNGLQSGEHGTWGDDNVIEGKEKTAYLAEGGEVPSDEDEGVLPADTEGADAGNPSQGASNPQSIQGYLQGADAMPGDMAMALEAQIDPQGQMDPNARKLAALKGAGSPDKQWALLQHYRQKFNAYNAFAGAAAQGTPQKPPDLMASARAATQAYQNLPDGKNVQFVPTQGGVRVIVRDAIPPGKHFDGETGRPSMGQPQTKRIGWPDQQKYEAGGAVEDPDEQDPETTGAIPEGPPGDDPGAGTPVSAPSFLGGAPPHERLRDFMLSTAQYLGFLKKTGQADAVLDKGVENTLNEAKQTIPAAFMPGAQGAYTRPSQGTGPQIGDQGARPQFPGQQGGQGGAPRQTPVKVPSPENYTLKDVLHEVDQEFPSVGMSQQRADARRQAIQTWMANRAKIEAEQTKGQAATDRAALSGGLRLQGQQYGADKRLEGVNTQQQHGDTRANQKFQTQRDIASATESGRNDRFSQGERGKNDRTIMANKPGTIGNADKLNQARGALGPGQQQPSPAQNTSQMKLVNGKWYKRGPSGEAIEVAGPTQ